MTAAMKRLGETATLSTQCATRHPQYPVEAAFPIDSTRIADASSADFDLKGAAMPHRRFLAMFLTVCCLIGFAPDARASTPAEKCTTAKIKAAGKKYAAKANCYAKAASHSEAVDPACLQKAETKFADAYAKAEAKGGCTTLNDAANIETKVDVCVADMVGDLACGNGVIDGDEQCDDGNTTSGDGCSSSCQNECGPDGSVCATDSQCCSLSCSGGACVAGSVCGDGVVSGPEQCDDGNVVSGDGCSSTCQIECSGLGAACSASAQCCTLNCFMGACAAAAVCGNSVVEAGEQCDDGNVVSGDGCSSTCQSECASLGAACAMDAQCCSLSCASGVCVTVAVCGDGVMAGAETCDDGNNVNGDGCSATCQVENGYTCTGSPSTCTAICSDGIVTGGEQCDDGNLTSGDGCDASCVVEVGYQCTGSPSICVPLCLSPGTSCTTGSECCSTICTLSTCQ